MCSFVQHNCTTLSLTLTRDVVILEKFAAVCFPTLSPFLCTVCTYIYVCIIMILELQRGTKAECMYICRGDNRLHCALCDILFTCRLLGTWPVAMVTRHLRLLSSLR